MKTRNQDSKIKTQNQDAKINTHNLQNDGCLLAPIESVAILRQQFVERDTEETLHGAFPLLLAGRPLRLLAFVHELLDSEAILIEQRR